MDNCKPCPGNSCKPSKSVPVKPPKLTLILVTEQTQYAQMQYLQKYLKRGLGFLWKRGLNYTNATLSHVTVDTGPSHSGWSTGAYSSVHGIVDNEWYSQGIEQYSTDDYTTTSPYTLTYVPNTNNGNPNGQVYPMGHTVSYGLGEGNKYILSDTLADQLVMHSTRDVRKEFYFVTNVGQNDNPANLVPGQLGVPFFFDQLIGGYTTTQAWLPSARLEITGANGSGYGALASLTVVNGVITGVILMNGGINYQTPLSLTAINPTFDAQGNVKAPLQVAQFSYTMKTQLQIVGSIAGTTLTVTSTNTPVTIGTVLGNTGGVIAGTVIVAQLTSMTFTVSLSQTIASGTSMAEQYGGVISSIQVVSGGNGYDGGLPDWVVEWNNKRNFPSISSYTNQMTYPADSPCYTDFPLIQNFSRSYGIYSDTNPGTNTLGVTVPVTSLYPPGTPPLEQTNGTGATAIATLAVEAVFQGYISGTTLTVPDAPSSGTISIGQMIQVQLAEPGKVDAGTTLVLPNTQIIAMASGTTGLAGKYTVYPVQTAAGQTVGSSIQLVTFQTTSSVIGQVILTNGGQDYTYYEDYTGVTVTGITQVIAGSPRPGIGPKGLPAQVESTCISGVVTNLELVFGGNGYGPSPVITMYPISPSDYLPWYDYAASYLGLRGLTSFTKRLIQKRKTETEELVVFINPFINHDYSVNHGSFAIDTVDSYYQFDRQLGRLFKWIYKQFDPKDVLLGWVTCEGNIGIYGLWWQRGYKTVINMDSEQLGQLMNEAIYQKTGVVGASKHISISDVWMSSTYFQQTPEMQQTICEVARDTLRQVSGIKSVFITHELLDGRYIPQSLEESYLILESYPGRSGQLKFLVQPMSGAGGAPVGFGTLASTSWDSGCHSPLCLYRKGVLSDKIIHEPVQVERLPITLAEILQVPRPTGASRLLGPLPGVLN